MVFIFEHFTFHLYINTSSSLINPKALKQNSRNESPNHEKKVKHNEYEINSFFMEISTGFKNTTTKISFAFKYDFKFQSLCFFIRIEREGKSKSKWNYYYIFSRHPINFDDERN